MTRRVAPDGRRKPEFTTSVNRTVATHDLRSVMAQLTRVSSRSSTVRTRVPSGADD